MIMGMTKVYKMARKCSVTGEGMNKGWIVEDAGIYFKYEKDALEYIKAHGYKDMEESVQDDFCYYTEWEDEEDFQYLVIDNHVIELEDIPCGPNHYFQLVG